MTSSAYNMNLASRKMPSVLFPTRRFAIDSRNKYNLAETTSTIGNEDDSNAIKWLGMNPLEMISHLAHATEQVEANKGLGQGPIVVGTTKLSTGTPLVPPLQKKTQLRKTRHGKSDDNKSVTTIEIDDDDDESAIPLAPWDLSFLVEQDEQATEAAKHLSHLARTVEKMPHYALVGGSYQRIRAHIEGTTTWIHSSYSGNLCAQRAAEKASLLQQLYTEVIQQMQGLVEMTCMLGQTEQPQVKREEPVVVKMEEETTPLSNTEFADYMNNWLRDNWTNPFADDDGLRSMSQVTGRTPIVISNWLINARTRKWRPAVIKAFTNKRPASLLLEDAINIFDDKPLRQLTVAPDVQMSTARPASAVPDFQTSTVDFRPATTSSAVPDFQMSAGLPDFPFSSNKRRKMY